MKIKDVLIMQEAVDDLSEGRAFYDFQEPGVGNYFWDCLVADIESLVIYAGIHSRNLDLYKMFSRRFPMPSIMTFWMISITWLRFYPCAGIRHGF